MKESTDTLIEDIIGLPWLMRRRLEIFYTHLPRSGDNLQKLRHEARLCSALADFNRKRRFMLPIQTLLVEDTAFEDLAVSIGFKRENKNFPDICRQLRLLCTSYVRDRRRNIKDDYQSLKQSRFLNTASCILNRRISERGLESFYQLRQKKLH